MSKQKKLPWVRFVPSKVLAMTRGMKDSEIGIFMTLVSMMFDDFTPLEEDHERLARQCGSDRRRFARILSDLKRYGKITEKDGGLWCDMVEDELEFRAKKSQAGKEAAESRWGKDKEINDGSMRTHSFGNATAMPIESLEVRNKNQEEEDSSSSRIPLTVVSGGLPLDETANLAFDGDNIKLTNRQLSELEQDYPGINIRGTARMADRKFPHRRNRKSSAFDYLCACLDGQDRDRRQNTDQIVGAFEEPAADPVPQSYSMCRDKVRWWREVATKEIRKGVWNAHLWGALPWESDTECLPGVFSVDELQRLKGDWDAECERRAGGSENISEKLRDRRSQNAVSAV